MKLIKICGVFFLTIAVVLMMLTSGCFGSTSAANSSGVASPTVVKPKPKVENVVATTSGTQLAYYATLDIKVKNEGAEGTILVQATITQSGKNSTNEMPVFLKQGETHELKLTFPLVWEGGDFTSDVKTLIP